MMHACLRIKHGYWLAILLSGVMAACTAQTVKERTVPRRVDYTENFNYRDPNIRTNTFNTWIWRKDGSGVIEPMFSGDPECRAPSCVELAALPVDSTGECRTDADCFDLFTPQSCVRNQCLPYANGEMYNNSCCRQGVGQPFQQDYDRLCPSNAWTPMCALVTQACNATPDARFRSDAWNTASQCQLINSPGVINNPFTDFPQFIKDMALNVPYHYQSLQMRMRAINPREAWGSRGWGYWNTISGWSSNEFAWFIELQTDRSPGDMLNGFWAMTKGADRVCFQKLPVDPRNWYTYTIVWNEREVLYGINGRLVHREDRVVPHSPMSFHNWVDNAVFTYNGEHLVHQVHQLSGRKSNLMSQFMVRDAIALEPGSASSDPLPQGQSFCFPETNVNQSPPEAPSSWPLPVPAHPTVWDAVYRNER